MIGSTCAHFYSTCQEAADASAIPFETSSQVLRFPGDPSRTVDALCFVHDDRIYTNIACDDLNPGGCTSVYRSTEQDTCKDFGMRITPYRSKAQYISLTDKWGRNGHYFACVSGITKPANGGSYTGCAMKSTSDHCNQWQATDGGDWWIRDTAYGEPNGDYYANCWLAQYSHNPDSIGFNDLNCAYTFTRYICIGLD
eukprot:m.380486 g.380486  ORF g.380486 m.380486 type:complete len:197 (-) comp20036_c0_seq3:235-825(-)